MKSIIQEENSILKAVEKSWIKAGRPKSFSIKILEEEEKNFIGFTRKPAKVAIFFEEIKQPFVKQPFVRKKPFKKQPQERPYKKAKRPEPTPRKKTAEPKEKRIATFWKDEMVEASVKWTKDILQQLKLQHVKFTVNARKYHLRLHFDSPLLRDPNKQKALFRNFSFLLMQSLRYKFKKPFTNLKTVFISV